MTVEQVFAPVKQFRVLACQFRNNLAYYNDIFINIYKLYNLKQS
jgi:hypothetical protein